MTKKCIFATLLFAISFNSNLFAQEALKKGIYSLSGSITFTNSTNESKYDETKSLDIFVSPALTYFFIDNLSAGLSLSYGYYELTFKDKLREVTYIQRPFSIGALVRYYISSTKFIPFVEAGYRYSNSINGNEDMNTLSFAGGINYFLSKSVALEPYLEYKKTNYIVADQKISGVSVGMRINYFIVD
ncbi:MAG: outer membrane beta-barrel protein [Melioribacteraceae bacterium]